MSSSKQQGNGKKKAVRFSKDDDDDVAMGAAGRTKKRKRIRNDDEQDDIDDWRPEDDDDDDAEGLGDVAVVSEHELLQAKRKRRAQRELLDGDPLLDEVEGDEDEMDVLLGDDDAKHHPKQRSSTKIDNRTSLAAEGIEIEPFHMNDEREDGTGYFEGDTYVFRQRSADEEPDAWLESLGQEDEQNDKDGDDAKKQWAMQRTEQQRADALQEEQDNLDEWSEEELYAKLLPHLAAHETVMQAVQRYGALMKAPPVKKKQHSDNNSTNFAQQQHDDKEARQLAKDSFNDVTEAANALLLKGKTDIYQSHQSQIEAALTKIQQQQKQKQPPPSATADSTGAATATAPPVANNVQWEYRGSQDHQIHGPYSSQDMLNWIRAGYFVGPSAVQIRSVQPAAKPLASKSTQEDLLSDLMEDDDNDEDDTKAEASAEVEMVRGEWQMSDKVDFSRYVAKY